MALKLQLAPSKNPEQESKKFSKISLICGIASLLLWFFGIAAVGMGLRGAILSKRVNDKKSLTFSIIGVILGMISLSYYYIAR